MMSSSHSSENPFFENQIWVCQDLCVNFFKSISPRGGIMLLLAQVVADPIRKKDGELK